MKLSQYTKSILAALLAGLGSLQVALDDNVVTQSEWVKVAIATAAALGIVWGVPNTAAAVTGVEVHGGVDVPDLAPAPEVAA